MHDLLNITFRDLLNPAFYIDNGGIWVVLFIIFAETGLMIGFFLPGDSLLFVSGIYSRMLINSILPGGIGSDLSDLMILFLLISAAGIAGNEAGYWFGLKAGPTLYRRKDTLLFKKRHLYQAKEFYDRHGAAAIVLARFLPIIRTFAPIVAGIVKMDKRKFLRFNMIGSAAWVFALLTAGHYLEKLFADKFGFDLRKHLVVIVIFIVLITTVPVIYKLIFGREDSNK